MATASGTVVSLARGVVKQTWTLTGTVTVGRPATLSRYPDKTLSVRGTFAGGTVLIIGSNQSATVAQGSLATQSLNDTRGEGNALSFSAANTVAILENPNLIYPKLTTTSGTTSLTIEIVAQSTRR